MTTLGSVSEIGPAGQGVRGIFDRTAMPSPDGMEALWFHKTDVTQCMLAKPDTHIVAKPGKERQARRLWGQRGTLLLPTRARLNTVRTLSVKLNIRVLGSGWVPCKPNISEDLQDTLEKSICSYLNSSIGVLAVLGNRSNKIPSYPQLSMDDLHRLVVPDFVEIGEAAMRRLAAAYDALRESALLPLPQMDADPVRRELDTVVCAALGIDEERVATIRRHIAAEPSVTGKRYAGLGG